VQEKSEKREKEEGEEGESGPGYRSLGAPFHSRSKNDSVGFGSVTCRRTLSAGGRARATVNIRSNRKKGKGGKEKEEREGMEPCEGSPKKGGKKPNLCRAVCCHREPVTWEEIDSSSEEGGKEGEKGAWPVNGCGQTALGEQSRARSTARDLRQQKITVSKNVPGKDREKMFGLRWKKLRWAVPTA